MDRLTAALIELVSNAPPKRSAQLAALIRTATSPQDTEPLNRWAVNPRAKKALSGLWDAWRETPITPVELAAMLTATSAAYHHAKLQQEIELVWTGPSSPRVATRKTEQALLQVIEAARRRLFITSFVAYDVEPIMSALRKAMSRDVEISMLLESSEKHGGGVSIDVIARMRTALPRARIYFWHEKDGPFAGGKVHAKVAVCDDRMCFVSSANLTGHAMERNMEAGVLVHGGPLPRNLHQHLESLVTVKILKT